MEVSRACVIEVAFAHGRLSVWFLILLFIVLLFHLFSGFCFMFLVPSPLRVFGAVLLLIEKKVYPKLNSDTTNCPILNSDQIFCDRTRYFSVGQIGVSESNQFLSTLLVPTTEGLILGV